MRIRTLFTAALLHTPLTSASLRLFIAKAVGSEHRTRPSSSRKDRIRRKCWNCRLKPRHGVEIPRAALLDRDRRPY